VLLLKRQGEDDAFTPPDEETREKAPPRRRRIRCPLCAWEPRPEDRWGCVCFCVWNTFDTGGVCPACGRHWTETQCLRCGEWSPHEAWYEDPDDDAGA